MYPQYPRHWLGPTAALLLKEFFYLASLEIASRLDHNPHSDERGLTDEFVRFLTGSPLITSLQSRLNTTKSTIALTLHETTVRSEPKIGADLGLIIRVATDDVQYQRSALFQAKKLQPKGEVFDQYCSYGLDSSRARNQADAMARHSSASFFILYNPSLTSAFARPEQSEELVEVTERLLDSWVKRQTDKSVLGTIPNFPSKVFALPYDPSDAVSILPAATIKSARPSSLRAGPIHKYTVSLSDFMTDDMIQGKIGDPTREAANTAQGKNRNFDVRYSIGLELRSGRFFTGEALMPLFQ